MRLSKASRYALYAVVMMAAEPERRLTAARLATELGISDNHVAKVLQQLARARLVSATRGSGGGYRLDRSADELTMLEVVEAIDGAWTSPCATCDLSRGLPGGACRQHFATCGVHDVLAELDRRAYFTLESITVATLARRGARVVRLPRVS